MSDIKSYIKESRNQEIEEKINSIIKELNDEKLLVDFGKIGLRTTYALIHSEDYSIEIVGYTFLRDMKYNKENIGRLKALQQAVARKKMAEREE